MTVVDAVEIIVDFFTEWFKIISPAFAVSKICTFGIQAEFDFVLQTVEHGVEHVFVFCKEACVYSNSVNQLSLE